ncbi:hypothetical protein PHYPSEUDO_000455 [Phytophthora pseudosyringae]|uniref:Uncharacterized protein n=1 Tax=Phytophthora pseudosyringae TaxID=221518 RepID=A0A8T1V5H9_9STRA|nr:hypothetical protein PHYPSEUDO_000455 [Phytophthora pseudosyringae]
MSSSYSIQSTTTTSAPRFKATMSRAGWPPQLHQRPQLVDFDFDADFCFDGRPDIDFHLDDDDWQRHVVLERHHQLQLRVQRHGRWLGHRNPRQGHGQVFVHHRGCVCQRPGNGTQDNMAFMNNLNIDYTGADSSPQGYATGEGSATTTQSTAFGGSLADASDS